MLNNCDLIAYGCNQKASKLLGPIAVKRDQEHMRQRQKEDGDRLLGPRNDSNNNNYIRFKLNQTIYDYRLPKEKVKVTELRFSPDGTHLLIISWTTTSSNKLRISIIKQTESSWDLIYDHL
ncbi:hypothetical protein H4Q26_010363 [Puccinia striiformis f. sp. tritici PST-130]|nr:hypothetical protein H4Q26_010363 [Puccinia striiformis f. sp. tritici PST-130]